MRISLSAKTREVLRFISFSVVTYTVFILGFAWFYYASGSISLSPWARPPSDHINFMEAVYFSIISFHTIGFGDIQPVTDLARQIVMVQSTISLFFTSIFSGFLVYFVIRRPHDIFSTRFIYIRHRKDRYMLSIRLGNKGREIIDLQGRFEAWTIENNSRLRVFKGEFELPDLEHILYFDLDLSNPDHQKLQKALAEAFSKKFLLHMKFSVIGNDIKTGEQVAFAKYYDSNHLRFGTHFLNVYSWDPSGHRTDFRWGNFERIEAMNDLLIQAFIGK